MVNRYFLSDFVSLWSDTSKYECWLKIELAVIKALKNKNVIPSEDAKYILRNAKFAISRIHEIENETKHDVFAFILCVTENLDARGKWFHYGLTSTDIVDTSQSLILKKANNYICEFINNLLLVLKEKAIRYKEQVCIGRTHGIYAELTSFGYKFAIWYKELLDLKEKFTQARQEIEVCKLSGAVGNFANNFIDVQDYVAKELGLYSIYNATQVVSRINHAYYVSIMTLIANLCNKIATEMRHLARSEVNEINESFSKNQRGSSAMPHKKNPIGFENITGLSRLFNGFMVTAFSNISLWHERDISHSSNERYILCDTTSTLAYMLKRITKLIKEINVNVKNIEENYKKSFYKCFSQHFMLYLIKNNNIKRGDAHSLVKKLLENCDNLEELIVNCKKENVLITKNELLAIFDKNNAIRNINTIYKKLKI